MMTMLTTHRLRRPPGNRTLTVGDLKASYAADGAVQLRPQRWLPDTTPATWKAHPEYLDDTGNLVAGIGGLLVERGDRALLIDAGVGPQEIAAQPENPQGRIHGGALPDSLAALGRSPRDIEAVAFTHLHIDHVGWAERGLFPVAGYLVAEQEWANRRLLHDHGTTPQILSALQPRVRTVTAGEEIFPGVRVRLLPGHTPGHTAFEIVSAGRRLVAFGDALHSPIQVAHPQWSAVPDHDPAAAADARRRLVADLAEPDALGFGMHFADVQFGRAVPDGMGYRWEPQP